MKTERLLQQDALIAAQALLGWTLHSQLGGVSAGGIIIETEAYHGADDPASHAYRGMTTRTAPMYQGAGTIYVYFSYGLHYCVNLVTGPAGEAQAVLLRALWPTVGLPAMKRRRGMSETGRLANGPANLAQALGINLSQTGSRLGDELNLEPPRRPLPPEFIKAGPRVGISKAVDLPWRFRVVPTDLIQAGII